MPFSDVFLPSSSLPLPSPCGAVTSRRRLAPPPARALRRRCSPAPTGRPPPLPLLPHPPPPPPAPPGAMPRVYIGRLSYQARERDVERFFKGYGKILEVDLKNG